MEGAYIAHISRDPNYHSPLQRVHDAVRATLRIQKLGLTKSTENLSEREKEAPQPPVDDPDAPITV